MQNDPAGGTETLTREQVEETVATPWSTVLYNDPINTFPYVIGCCLKILKCTKEQAELYTNQVHYEGKSVVYTGDKEQAERYAEAFSAAHIWCRAERTS